MSTNKKKITIALDQLRPLKFSINAMVELEERFGVAIPSLFKEGNVGFGLILAVVRIGLAHGGMKLSGTVKNQELLVGDLIQEHWIDEGHNLTDLMEKVTEAFNAAGIFDTEANEGDPQANPKVGAVDETTA